jgi:hypothetical protein
MNVYEKLLEARAKFHAAPITKSGYNSFAKYNYFELADFVVPLLGIFKEVGLIPITSFDKDTAHLTLIDVAKPEDRIQFTSPMGKAELKGTHEIQQIGAVQTYQRRYLYTMAMDIVEHDQIDSGEHGTAPERDVYAEMAAAKTMKELQTIFAEAYQNTTGQEQKKVKSEYDRLKANFTQKVD